MECLVCGKETPDVFVEKTKNTESYFCLECWLERTALETRKAVLQKIESMRKYRADKSVVERIENIENNICFGINLPID